MLHMASIAIYVQLLEEILMVWRFCSLSRDHERALKFLKKMKQNL